jgi:hypothetical protein
LKIRSKKNISTEVLIGHLDTGVTTKVPGLKGRIDQYIVIDSNGISLPQPKSPVYASHGTHTAGIICGNPEQGIPGVAPEARLCTVGVSPRGKTILKLLAGMDALLDFDIRIACMTIGIPGETPVFWPFIQAFLQKGILPILPIGNGGVGTGYSPGCYPGTLSVGAIDERGKVAKFSGSYGQGNSLKPELMAPGVNILSANPNGLTQHKSGTSMACAYVAGVAARLLQARPEATASELRHALISTTIPSTESYRSRYGIVQLEAALEAIIYPKAQILAFSEIPIPAFLQNIYIDNRFQTLYQRAGEWQELEAIILPKVGGQEKDKALAIPEASQHLIGEITEKSGQMPSYIRYFQHADVAHLRASRKFFLFLLDHPGLFACSAVR